MTSSMHSAIMHNTAFCHSFLKLFRKKLEDIWFSQRLNRIRSPLWDKNGVISLEIGQLHHVDAATKNVMAQRNPRLDLKRKESIADVVHDLELLFPNGYGTVTSMDEGRELRDKRVQELMKTNGTLPKVL